MRGGTNFYKHRYRCRNSKCYIRFSVKVRRKRPVKCPSCGGEARSIEAERARELAKQERCHCLNIPFPHKKGSITGCEHHVAGSEREWDELDEANYQTIIRTPRSG